MNYSAELEFRNGMPVVLLDGEAVPPVIYGLSDIAASRCHTEQARHNAGEFIKAGIRLVQCDWNLRDGWTCNHEFDISAFLNDIRQMVEEYPMVRFIIRLHMNPPDWYLQENPDEMTVFGIGEPLRADNPDRLITGDALPSRRVALGSELWVKDACNVLADMCRQLTASETGSHVIGIQPACGVNGEWHWWAGDNHPDYSPAQTRFFRNFLKGKYQSVDKLRKAWNNDEVDFETAEIPPVRARIYASDGIIRDPECEQAVIDSLKAQMLAPAVAIEKFCETVKKSSGRPMLTGAFFGYIFGTGPKNIAGHLEVDLLLKSPYVDYTAAPAVYGETRLPGRACISRGLVESVRLNKKLSLSEMDQRPEGVVASAPGGDPARDEMTINLMRRGVMEVFTRGMGHWYYDHRVVPGGGFFEKFGWWDTPVLAAEVVRENQIFNTYFDRPYHSHAEILGVWDAESYYHVFTGWEPAPLSWHEDELFETLGRSGAVCDHIYWNDIKLADLDQYKIVVIANKIVASPEDHDFVRRKLLQNGRQVIFLYAAGFSDGQKISVENMEKFTGIKTARAGFYKGFMLDGELLRSTMHVDPVFRADDPAAEVVACLGTGQEAAVVRKSVENGTAWYFSLPYLSASFVRNRMLEAGGHLYSDKELFVNAGRGLLSLHAPAADNYLITLRNGKKVQLDMKLGDTVVLDAESGEIL